MKRITAKAFYSHIEEDKKEFKAGRLRDASAKRERRAIRKDISGITEHMQTLAKTTDIPTPEAMGEIVEATMRRVFLGKGKLIYTGIIATGALALALTAIFGGVKVLAAFFFFRQ